MTVDRSLVVVEASLARVPSVLAAAGRWLSAQYRLALVGPGAERAAADWREQGLPVAVVSDEAFAATVEVLRPAVALAPLGQAIPEAVPNRLVWSPTPVSRYTDGVYHLHDVSAWVQEYLAPRVPRHFSEQTKP